MRRVLAGGFVAALTLLLGILPTVLVPPAAAQAATVVAPGVPNPVNILPSVAVGAKVAATSPEALAVFMLQWSKDPRFWRAAQAVQAGGATAADTATVAAEASRFAVPSVKAAPLLKVVGGASAVMAAGQVGLMMGDGAARLFGFKDDDVCAEQNGILTAISAITNGVDCTTFNNKLAESIRNLDQQPVQTQSSVCSPFGNCGQYLGYAAYTATPGGPWIQYCFKFNPASTQAAIDAGAWGGAKLSFETSRGTVGSARAVYSTNYCLQKFPGATDLMVDYWYPVGDTLKSFKVFSMNSIGTVLGSTSYTFKPEDTTRPNVSRAWRCTTTTVSGLVYAHDSSAWTENDPVFGTPVCPTVPPAEVPARTVIEQTTPGAPSAPVFDQPTTPEYQQWRTAYPECGTGTCMLDLKKADTSCFASPAPCSDWFADPNKAEQYQCTYGAHAVALSECNLYAPTFKPDSTATGNVYADPETGQDVGVKTGPGGTVAPGEAVGDPEQPRDCFPTGWGVLNPVEWVLKPVGCALQAAFVPRQSAIDRDLDEVKSTWSSRLPGQVAALVASWEFVPPPSGCGGITVDVFFLGPPFQIMNACPGSMLADLAMWSRIFGNVAFSVYAVVAITRHVGRIVGFGGLGDDSGGGA